MGFLRNGITQKGRPESLDLLLSSEGVVAMGVPGMGVPGMGVPGTGVPETGVPA